MSQDISVTFRNLLQEAEETLGKANIAPYDLSPDGTLQPFIGGEFDVKDSWETVVYPLINRLGVHVAVRLRFEVSTHRHRRPLIMVMPHLEAWYPKTPTGRFPVHKFALVEAELIHTTMKPLSEIVEDALSAASRITPDMVASRDTWCFITVDEEQEG